MSVRGTAARFERAIDGLGTWQLPPCFLVAEARLHPVLLSPRCHPRQVFHPGLVHVGRSAQRSESRCAYRSVSRTNRWPRSLTSATPQTCPRVPIGRDGEALPAAGRWHVAAANLRQRHGGQRGPCNMPPRWPALVFRAADSPTGQPRFAVLGQGHGSDLGHPVARQFAQGGRDQP